MLTLNSCQSSGSKYAVKALFCMCIYVFICLNTHAQEALPAHQLIKNLQQGGHIIYMRHSQTNRSERDSDKKDFSQCDNQRNLSNKGRKLAKTIGKTIQSLNIPIGKVLTSPYCRCKETAKLVFGTYSVENDLQFSMSKKTEELKFLGDRLKTLMQKSTAGKNNAVFVGHTSNLREGLGIWPKPEAVIAVFKHVEGDVLFKGFIKPNDW